MVKKTVELANESSKKKEPKERKKPSKTKTKKVTQESAVKSVEPEVMKPKVVTPPPVELSENKESDEIQSSVSEILVSIMNTANEISLRQKDFSQQLKSFNRSYKKELKELQRSQSRNKKLNKKDPNRPKRAPSGFAVPSEISGEMCKFLGINNGTHLSRTEVTRKLTTYIREKNLQIPSNRRSFQPDKALSSILGPLQEIDQEKGYTYFNLQRYITPHIMSSSSSSSK